MKRRCFVSNRVAICLGYIYFKTKTVSVRSVLKMLHANIAMLIASELNSTTV